MTHLSLLQLALCVHSDATAETWNAYDMFSLYTACSAMQLCSVLVHTASHGNQLQRSADSRLPRQRLHSWCMCRPVRVLYSTSLDKSKKSSMSKIIKRLGGSVEDAEGPDFTHFVALQPTAANQTDRGFKKSINALIALAAGQPSDPTLLAQTAVGEPDCISGTSQPVLFLSSRLFLALLYSPAAKVEQLPGSPTV